MSKRNFSFTVGSFSPPERWSVYSHRLLEARAVAALAEVKEPDVKEPWAKYWVQTQGAMEKRALVDRYMAGIQRVLETMGADAIKPSGEFNQTMSSWLDVHVASQMRVDLQKRYTALRDGFKAFWELRQQMARGRRNEAIKGRRPEYIAHTVHMEDRVEIPEQEESIQGEWREIQVKRRRFSSIEMRNFAYLLRGAPHWLARWALGESEFGLASKESRGWNATLQRTDNDDNYGTAIWTLMFTFPMLTTKDLVEDPDSAPVVVEAKRPTATAEVKGEKLSPIMVESGSGSGEVKTVQQAFATPVAATSSALSQIAALDRRIRKLAEDNKVNFTDIEDLAKRFDENKGIAAFVDEEGRFTWEDLSLGNESPTSVATRLNPVFAELKKLYAERDVLNAQLSQPKATTTASKTKGSGSKTAGKAKKAR